MQLLAVQLQVEDQLQPLAFGEAWALDAVFESFERFLVKEDIQMLTQFSNKPTAELKAKGRIINSDEDEKEE